MSQPSWIGKILAERYKIEDLLGQGGMSAVYRATDSNLRRVVAVKMIHPHLSSDPDFVRRFEEEATAVAQLRHPNIIQVYDYNHEGDTYYMVLEFVPGETLQDHLKRLNKSDRQMSLPDAINTAVNICDAIEYANGRGLIHRDIKPANIMLSVQGQAILMDFGIAKIIGGQHHTATGAVIGTALYMSPEQIRGQQLDQRSDIYSLGVTLFEMVSGRPPFEADSAMTLMMMHVNDPVPNLHKLNLNLPAGLVAVINKALAKNPDDRYKTAGQMASALRDVQTQLATRPKAAIPAGIATILEQPAPEPIDTTRIEQPAAPEVPPPSPPENMAVKSGSIAVEGLPGLPSPPASPSSRPTTARKGGMRPVLIGGGLAGVLILACLIVGGIFAYNQFIGNRKNAPAGLVTATSQEPAAFNLTKSPLPTATNAPTFTPAPPTATLTPATTAASSLTSTPTVPAGPFARINTITIDDQDRYVVEYEAFEFKEQISDTTLHVHFFFDTVSPEDAGVPGQGPWILYGGPSPFTGSLVTDRKDATQMCILVANPDHSVQPNSGNCFALPDVAPPTPAAGNSSEITDDKGTVMVFVPSGEFAMGSDTALPLVEQPIHMVEVPDYYIDKFEVTNEQYAACVNENICELPTKLSSLTHASYYDNPQFANFPVVFIQWADAKQYCEWRGARLLTEAEWEKAARGTDGRTYPWGEEINCDYANLANCVGDTVEVGSYPKDISPYGVYDMGGNVREFVEDWFNAYPGGDPKASSDYGTILRIVRGGGFDKSIDIATTASRAHLPPEISNFRVGARCALTP
jgi:serine/threonine-protein kinase